MTLDAAVSLLLVACTRPAVAAGFAENRRSSSAAPHCDSPPAGIPFRLRGDAAVVFLRRVRNNRSAGRTGIGIDVRFT